MLTGPVSVEDVSQAIKAMDLKTAAGPDQMLLRGIVGIFNKDNRIILRIFSIWLKTAKIPETMKDNRFRSVRIAIRFWCGVRPYERHLSPLITPHVHGEPGAKSFIDRLILAQGFVSSRAATSLQSIESHPSSQPFVSNRVHENLLPRTRPLPQLLLRPHIEPNDLPTVPRPQAHRLSLGVFVRAPARGW
ncbi:hypothetical protein chiPu_0020456 [Chiloscyllium punctatum]|uniref:Uncharacterized protein n=1 Tax=Chiloscyllium punctatum TaxID=137246 RepID=A0A401RFR3_CHIPU|nr:hypothetical protein [Chiloscyllium punctatum]